MKTIPPIFAKIEDVDGVPPTAYAQVLHFSKRGMLSCALIIVGNTTNNKNDVVALNIFIYPQSTFSGC